MSRPLSRPAALLPVSAMQTFRISRPVATHRRPATCAEIDCEAWRCGWTTVVPVGSTQEATVRQAMAGAIDGVARHGREEKAGDGLVSFRFAAGQPCFRQTKHTKSLERPENYLVRGGDWRRNLGLVRRHTSPDSWVDDFSTTLDQVRRRIGA